MGMVVVSGVKAPVVPIAKELITLLVGFEVYRKDPFGDIARPASPEELSETGNPVRRASAPVLELKL